MITSVELCGTDHSFQIPLSIQCVYLGQTEGGGVAQRFIRAISACFITLNNLMDPAALWDTKHKIPDATQESTDNHSNKRQNFIMQKAIEAHVAQLTAD